MSVEPLALAIRRLAVHESLDAEALAQALGVIMRGQGSPAPVAALVMAPPVQGRNRGCGARLGARLSPGRVVVAARGPREGQKVSPACCSSWWRSRWPAPSARSCSVAL